MYVAIMGYGVVGSGVASLLKKNHEHIVKKSMQDAMELKYILDRRTFPGDPYEHLVISDFAKIVEDDEVKIVVETMGGLHPAYEYVLASLKAGKHVVTSNKELVAAKGCELLKVAEEYDVNFLFEASVGGGIPIVRPLVTDFIANAIVEISGILNGTTNYILTQMKEYGKSYADALSEAQAKGYAEKDPTADVEGIDTCRKICILTGLATGVLPKASEVKTVGISKICGEDVKLLDKHGYSVKLLGRMVMNSCKPCLIVAPFVCGKDSPLAHVDDVFNGITVCGNTLGQTMFYGRGAGADPTASAVANDILSILKDGKTSFAPAFVGAADGDVTASECFTCRRYVRTSMAKDEVCAILGNVCDLGGAYITEKAFSEAEFDTLADKFDSVLRVL